MSFAAVTSSRIVIYTYLSIVYRTSACFKDDTEADRQHIHCSHTVAKIQVLLNNWEIVPIFSTLTYLVTLFITRGFLKVQETLVSYLGYFVPDILNICSQNWKLWDIQAYHETKYVC